MPRYYFVVSSPLGAEADEDGLDLPGNLEAREWAVRAVDEIRAENPNADWTNWHVEVLDAAGTVLVAIPLAASGSTMKH
jgi:hypothetical protein